MFTCLHVCDYLTFSSFGRRGPLLEHFCCHFCVNFPIEFSNGFLGRFCVQIGPIWGPFWDPRSQKIATKTHDFQSSSPNRFWAQFGCALEPPEPPKTWFSLSKTSFLQVSLFRLERPPSSHIEPLWSPKGTQTDTQTDPKT